MNPISSRAAGRVCTAACGIAAFGFAAAGGSFPSATPAFAAPAASQTLTFNVSARLTAGGNAQTIASRVQAKGEKVRIETKLGDRPVVFLAAPPYLYKLIPSAKAGVRWKSDKLSSGSFNVAMLFDPAAIRQQMSARGAKSLGSQLLDGMRTDVFQAKNVGGRGTDVKAWLRRGDALPLRVETRSKSFNSDVSWSNYRRNVTLSDALFKVPAGYSVRESQGKPGLF